MLDQKMLLIVDTACTTHPQSQCQSIATHCCLHAVVLSRKSGDRNLEPPKETPLSLTDVQRNMCVTAAYMHVYHVGARSATSGHGHGTNVAKICPAVPCSPMLHQGEISIPLKNAALALKVPHCVTKHTDVCTEIVLETTDSEKGVQKEEPRPHARRVWTLQAQHTVYSIP